MSGVCVGTVSGMIPSPVMHNISIQITTVIIFRILLNFYWANPTLQNTKLMSYDLNMLSYDTFLYTSVQFFLSIDIIIWYLQQVNHNIKTQDVNVISSENTVANSKTTITMFNYNCIGAVLCEKLNINLLHFIINFDL